MNGTRIYLSTAMVGAVLALTGSAGAATRFGHFAIVIGNNRPDDARRPALHFADDDALATHLLLREGGVESILLTRFDEDTSGLHQGVDPRAPPTWAALESAFEEITRRMRSAAPGERVELMLFYSGHGDVDRGEGYVALEDGRLTREKLQGLLARSPAASNHVVIDACRSYFMAFERGPGGHRAPYAGAFPMPSTPGKLGNTGFVLSTSSDRESHEWERYQAGVFTHQVRSALRGAADVDRDGRISYAELGAFLGAANAGISNPRFRPDFFVRPPGAGRGDLDAEIFSWHPDDGVVLLDRPDAGHIFVETARGERLLDVYPEAKQVLSVHLPAARPLFVRRWADDAEFCIAAAGPIALSTLEPERPRAVEKGALHYALEQLFAMPFGAATVRAYRAQAAVEAEIAKAPAGDATPPSPRPSWLQTAAGWTAVGAAASGLVLTGWAIERYETGRNAPQAERARRNGTIRNLGIGAAAAGGVAIVAGSIWLGCRLLPRPASEPFVQVAVSPVSEAGEPGSYVSIRGRW